MHDTVEDQDYIKNMNENGDDESKKNLINDIEMQRKKELQQVW